MTLLDELFSGDDERAAAAAPLAGAAHLAALSAALSGADADARWWAVAALAYVPGEQATQLLLRAAEMGEPDVRAAALHALGQHGGHCELPVLLNALWTESVYLARLATDSLVP